MRRSLHLALALMSGFAGILAFALLIGGADPAISSPAAAAPIVSAITPSLAYADVQTPIAITGIGFAAEISGTEVLTAPEAFLNTRALLDVTWLNSTTITGVIPALLPTGVYSVVVVNPDGGRGVLTDGMTLVWPPITPTIAAITPEQAPNDSQLWATVSGSDFAAYYQGAAVLAQPIVTLGTTELLVTYVNTDQLDVRIPVGIAPGVYTLTVTNPGGGWAQLTDAYTATLPPAIYGVSPTLATNDLDTTLVISGANFLVGPDSPEVYVGDTLVGIATGTSDALTTTVPWGLPDGVHDVTVVNGDGGADTLPDALTITHAMNSWETGGPYGGRATAMVQHPTDDGTVYAQIFGTGVFVTRDGAETWQLILLEELGQGLTMDSADPDVLYAGHEGGIYRTLDGGSTWQFAEVYNPPMNCFIHRATAHRTLPNAVYAAVRACGGGFTAAPGEGGIYFSSDLGATWVSRTGDLTNTKVSVVSVDPAAPDTLLAGTMDGEVFTSVDAGVHWQRGAGLGAEVRRLAFNPYVAGEAWMIISPENLSGVATLYRSSAPGFASWTPVTPTSHTHIQGIGFAPGKVWAAAGSLYWSDDAGATWTDMGGPWQGVDRVLPSTLDPQVVYANGGSGTYKSVDGGSSWQEKKQGLAGVIPESIASPRTQPDLAYAKTYELGLLTSTDGGHSWQEHGAFWVGGNPWKHSLAVDPITNTRLYLSYADHDSPPYVAVAEPVGGVWQETRHDMPMPPSAPCGTGTAMAAHPTRPGHLMAGATYVPCGASLEWEPGALFASYDSGDSWQALLLPSVISEVNSIAYAFWDPDVVYAGTRGTGILRSEDGGASWETLTGFPGDPYITTVAPHPNAADTVYALAETQHGSHIYASYDRGDTWEHLTEEAGVDVVVSPPNPGERRYSLLTSCGAFEKAVCRSIDGGRTWYTIWGSPRPTALGASSDSERNAVYIGSTGGLAAPVLMSLSETSLQTAGVYRFVTVPLNEGVYLPLVVR